MRCELNQPIMKTHGIRHQLSRAELKSGVVRRGGADALRHNKSINPTRDSMVFMVSFSRRLKAVRAGRLSPAFGIGVENEIKVNDKREESGGLKHIRSCHVTSRVDDAEQLIEPERE